MSDLWVCPKCRAPLVRDKSWQCSQGHSYDIARQGYTNLLLANRKNSREPGDSDDMISARKGFLDCGYYAPLVTAIATQINKVLQRVEPAEAQPRRLLDMGCGEGYYLRSLQAYLTDLTPQYIGVDISKPAIKKAAAADKLAQYAVASCYDIPLPDSSVHLALSVFSPVCVEETQRVLAANGYVVRVAPGANHLAEIKQRIYENYQAHDAPSSLEGFVLTETQAVENSITLTQTSHIKNLLAMTPFFWHGSPEAKEILLGLDTFTVTTHFLVQVFQVLEKSVLDTLPEDGLLEDAFLEEKLPEEKLPEGVQQSLAVNPELVRGQEKCFAEEPGVSVKLKSETLPKNKKMKHDKKIVRDEPDEVVSSSADVVVPKNQNIWKR